MLRYVYFLLLTALITGCSSVPGTDGNWIGYKESGKASFYAARHESRITASGEPYRHDLRTAAHKTLPLGSRVKVTNTENGKVVVVKVNDRGPFVKGRIIDLSRSAFNAIANTAEGVIDVQIEVVE